VLAIVSLHAELIWHKPGDHGRGRRRRWRYDADGGAFSGRPARRLSIAHWNVSSVARAGQWRQLERKQCDQPDPLERSYRRSLQWRRTHPLHRRPGAPSSGEVIYVGMYGAAGNSGNLPGHILSATLDLTSGEAPVWHDLTLNPVLNNPHSLNFKNFDISSIVIDTHDPQATPCT